MYMCGMPTMISHSHKFIFVHVYKVAGTSVSSALGKYRDWPIVNKAIRKIGIQRYIPMFANFGDHAHACEVQDKISSPVYSSYYKFAFVRNPWDWHVSLYHFMKQQRSHHRHNLVKSLSFPEFIDWHTKNVSVNQSDFVMRDGKMIVDFVGRFENLADDFGKVCKRIGIEESLRHSNRSKHANYRDYYDDLTRKQVAARFEEDIERFGYRF